MNRDRASCVSSRGAAAAALRGRGFTLLEAVMAMAVLTLIIGGTLAVLFQSERLFAQEMRQHTLDQTGRRVVDRLAGELRGAEPSSVLPLILDDSSAVQFRKVTGFSGGSAQLGPLTTFAFQLEAGESQNGLDDDGDGLADEGYLTYTEQGLAAVRLAGQVLGLRFNSTASGISYSVDIGAVDSGGAAEWRTFGQEVTFRNP